MQLTSKPHGSYVSDEEFLSDIRRVADQLGTTRLSATAYEQHGKYHASLCHKRFGSWSRATGAAGVECRKSRWVTLKQLLADIRQVGRSLKTSSLSESDYRKNGRYSRFVVRSLPQLEPCRQGGGIWLSEVDRQTIAERAADESGTGMVQAWSGTQLCGDAFTTV